MVVWGRFVSDLRYNERPMKEIVLIKYKAVGLFLFQDHVMPVLTFLVQRTFDRACILLATGR